MSRQARDPVSGSWMPIAGYPEIDAALDIESINPIQNQAVANPIEAIVNVYGSKNLLPNNATSQVINGVTFTVNSDGSITANGTATANTNLELVHYLDMNICGGKIISGCNSGSFSTYYLYVQQAGSPYTIYARCTDQPVILPVVSGNAWCRFYVISGTTLNNVTIYPMIRDSRITNPTYVPYAMTNRELTEYITPNITKSGWISNAGTITVPRIVMGCFIFLYVGGQNSGVSIYTLDGTSDLFLLYTSNNNITCTITHNANNTTTITCSGVGCYYSVVYSLRG